ncbi:hypothetical protein Emed_001322 [Eimeria media]
MLWPTHSYEIFLIGWENAAPKHKTLDEKGLTDLKFGQFALEDGLKYSFLSRFTRLTPDYNREGMEAAALKEVPKFLQQLRPEAESALKVEPTDHKAK